MTLSVLLTLGDKHPAYTGCSSNHQKHRQTKRAHFLKLCAICGFHTRIGSCWLGHWVILAYTYPYCTASFNETMGKCALFWLETHPFAEPSQQPV